MNLFGSRLKKLREQKGLTQSQFAEHFGLNESTYRNYENNQRDPGSKLTIYFARFLGVTPDYLCGIEEPKKKDAPQNKLGSIEARIDNLSTDSIKSLKEFVDYLSWKDSQNN